MLASVIFQDVDHFELPVWFSLTAHFAFGVTGALAGLRRGYDVIGVFFLAMITGGGGGLIRDGLLISQGPPTILTDERLLVVILLAALLTLFFYRYVDRLGRALAIVDALGLGAFAVHGVERSMEAGLSLPAVVVGGTLTAVGGGLLRDILVREEPLLFKPGQFYGLVAVGGCGLFLALLHWNPTSPRNAAMITIALVFAVRMLAIQFNWRTTALYHEPRPVAQPQVESPPAPPPVRRDTS